MTIRIRSIVPMLHVADLARSIAFYEKLGLAVKNTFTPQSTSGPTWASLECGSTCVMLTTASAPIVADAQAVIFYLYLDDVSAARNALIAAGIEAGQIEYPFYAPRGEFRVVDPDGFALMITHV